MNEAKAQPTELESQSALINDLLKLFLQTHSKNEFMLECLKRIRTWAGLSGIGIRVLDTLGNIPYQAQCGFTSDFVDSEKWLSTTGDECVCIRVASGRQDPQDNRLITPRGSFWCNNTGDFIAGLSENEKRRYRGVCLTHGFSSLAVIPIVYQDRTLGVLHLTDKRADAIPAPRFSFLETAVSSLLGEGIYRFGIEEKLQQNLGIQEVLTTLLKKSLEDLGLDNILNITLDLIHSYGPLSEEKKSAIFLADSENENGKMSLAVWRGFEEVDLLRCSITPQGVCGCGQAAAMQKPVYSSYDRDNQPGAAHYSVPIVYKNTTVGVLCLYLDSSHRRDEHEEQFLKAVADTLAGIIWRKRSEKLLRKLSLRMVSVQEEERRNIALELHDQIGQMLTGLKLMISQSIRSGDKARLELLQETQSAVTDLIIKVREISLNLRPSMLDDLGLLPALIWHFQRCKSQSNLNVDFRHSGLDSSVPKDVSIAAFRIVQEALTNVMRYAGVNDALVEVWTEQDWLHIRIEDRGKGFNPDSIAPGSSLGLQGMRERAMLLGGSLNVDSQLGRGTIVRAQLPLTIQSESVTITGN